MEVVIGAIGAHLTLGLISSITSAANGVFTLSSNIVKSTTTGANEVKQIIQETDLEFKIRKTEMFVSELKINENSPYTIQFCIHAVKGAMDDIIEELEQVHYRMKYNDNIWFGKSVRSYKFHNNKARLEAKLKNLEDRCKCLTDLLKSQDMLMRNPLLESNMSDSVAITKDVTKSRLNLNGNNNSMAIQQRVKIHERIEYITKDDINVK